MFLFERQLTDWKYSFQEKNATNNMTLALKNRKKKLVSQLKWARDINKKFREKEIQMAN